MNHVVVPNLVQLPNYDVGRAGAGVGMGVGQKYVQATKQGDVYYLCMYSLLSWQCIYLSSLATHLRTLKQTL